eukprot:55613-Pleurochrysis_carterae.AAC.1
MRASGHDGSEASIYGTLRGDAGPEVKLRGMITGPRRSQTHPRAAFTKQACPRMKGCGRARSPGESRIVVRSCSRVSSQACRSRKHIAGLEAFVGNRKSERSIPPAAAWAEGEGPCAAAQ